MIIDADQTKAIATMNTPILCWYDINCGSLEHMCILMFGSSNDIGRNQDYDVTLDDVILDDVELRKQWTQIDNAKNEAISIILIFLKVCNSNNATKS